MALRKKTTSTSSSRFLPKKGVGQIYVNIPGDSTIWVECDPEDPKSLNPVLDATIKFFLEQHHKLTGKPQLVKS